MFGRATIRLGIGLHSSIVKFLPVDVLAMLLAFMFEF